MSKKLYECIEITDLKDMLNKTRNIYADKPAYKIRTCEGEYKVFTHGEVRNMIDALGTALCNLGLKGKRIAVIGENRYEWEIAYINENKIKNGTVILADIQTEGIGTHGKKWYTDEENNIAFSFFVEMNCNLENSNGITLEIAETILKIFANKYNITLQIKEPNDIYYNGKKLGGIKIFV